MGKTGDSLQYHFPPRSGGGSLNGCRSPCREETGWPWVKMVVVVVVVVVVDVVFVLLFLLSIH